MPTWLVAVAVYSGWGLLTWFTDSLPWWFVLPVGSWLVAWHGSLQHETVHGYPSRHRWLNAALGWPPLGLWMPYALYRDSHLEHHRSPALTDPLADPESFYVTAERWATLGRLSRAVLIVNNTLVGRLVCGPFLAAGRFWAAESRRILAGDIEHAGAWLGHLALCAVLLVWVTAACGMSAIEYGLLFAWPGLALTLLRSFAEHRPGGAAGERSAIVETGPLSRLLFLNNNLHALHHARPDLPWHALSAEFLRHRAAILSANGGHRFAGGYPEIARRFAFRPKDSPVHPQPLTGESGQIT